jgi:hypothetical protein
MQCQTIRDIYDTTSERAKTDFIATLTRWLGESGTTQRAFSERVGYSPVSVSEFICSPHRCPENFVRVVSLGVPELAGEYIRYRMTADAPFYLAAGQGSPNLGIHRDIAARAARMDAIDAIAAALARQLADLKSMP